MPLHLLDFLGLDHHNHHCHDDSHLCRFDDIHSHQHGDVQLHHHQDILSSTVSQHRPSAAAFLSTPDVPTCSHPSRLSSSFLGDDLPAASLAAKVTAQQAASFLDSGPGSIDGAFLSGIGRSHASASSFLSVQKSLTEMVQSTPPAALVPLHALSIVGALPGHLAFELGEGFLFGFQKGFALALTGKLLGSAAAFGIGRSAVTCGCLKDRLKEQMNKWALCQKVVKGVEKGGGMSVFIIRMAPVPCVVKNYSPALLTDIPFSTYLLASFAGLVPTTAAHVYAGTLAPSAVALASGTSHMSGMQAVTLATPAVAGVLLTVFAGYYLRQYVIADSDGKENEEEESIDLDMIDKRKRD